MRSSKGFTLIELLIVVAIIAILALIAVPNLLEAQVRAKVARAEADLRTVATALEAYAVDYNDYPPNDGKYNTIPVELTTPVAYIASANLVDPFAFDVRESLTPYEAKSTFYTYTKIVTYEEREFWQRAGKPCPPEAVDHWSENMGAFLKYGKWRTVSKGPDRVYLDMSFPRPLRGSDIPYDPTNGTVSFGNILRFQNGRKPQ